MARFPRLSAIRLPERWRAKDVLTLLVLSFGGMSALAADKCITRLYNEVTPTALHLKTGLSTAVAGSAVNLPV